jgi:peptidoglycan/LPS O-acetylase OafA/YrhL
MVMLFHYGLLLDRSSPWARAIVFFTTYGWSGVDLFFVLSGFLITGILLDSRSAENYFSSFYARRMLRIFPAYYLSLVLLFLIIPRFDASVVRVLPPPYDRWMYLFYVQNWRGVLRRFILTPYWSLAVEEQFYLIWPLVVTRFAGRKLLGIIAAASTASVLVRFGGIAAGVSPEAIYVNTVTRMDSLLIGAACAVAVRDPALLERLRPHARWVWLLPLIPFLAVARPFITTRTERMGLGFTLVALSYAGLLLTAVLRGNPVLHRFLNSRPLIVLGKYSYAAYIWHFPIMHFVGGITRRLHFGVSFSILIMMAVTVLVSFASYHLVERWFLLLKKQFAPRVAKGAAGTCASGDGLPQAAQGAAGG